MLPANFKSNWKRTNKIKLNQGCPLSMMWHAMATDPPAGRIEKDRKIKGIKLGLKEIKIQQYADDVTVMISNKESLEEVFGHF